MLGGAPKAGCPVAAPGILRFLIATPQKQIPIIKEVTMKKSVVFSVLLFLTPAFMGTVSDNRPRLLLPASGSRQGGPDVCEAERC